MINPSTPRAESLCPDLSMVSGDLNPLPVTHRAVRVSHQLLSLPCGQPTSIHIHGIVAEYAHRLFCGNSFMSTSYFF
jgi:hypothetical protein